MAVVDLKVKNVYATMPRLIIMPKKRGEKKNDQHKGEQRELVFDLGSVRYLDKDKAGDKGQ